jgi:hypothetical protein
LFSAVSLLREPFEETPCPLWVRAGLERSDDKGAFGVKDVLDPEVLDAASPVGSEEVEAEAVFFFVENFQQAEPELGPLGGIDEALEDGVLDALTVIVAGFGDAAQAPAAFGSRC